MQKKIYIMGGAQTDFERNWTKEGKNMIALLKEAVEDGFKDANFTMDEMVKLNKENRVAAFVGNDNWRGLYDYALAHDFRFLSYGDACLFLQ